MKLLSVFVIIALAFCFSAGAQYTPLPQLDETKYENFVAALRIEAEKQDMPELKEVAEKMTYDEARRFMANPQVFADKLKQETKGPEAENDINNVRLGLIVCLLLNHFTNLSDDWKSSPRIGYALGLYAMFTLGSIYVLTELLYTYRVAGEKLSSLNYSQVLRLSFITLFATLVYAIQLENIRWLIGIGPVFAVGIGGKEVFKDDDTSIENDVEWGDGGLRRFQAGLTVMTGIMLSRGILLYLSYSLFFTKLFDGDSDYRMNMFRFAFAFPLNNR